MDGQRRHSRRAAERERTCGVGACNDRKLVVLRFEWNGLRIGDKVLLHDWASADLALCPAVVAFVDTHRDMNGVGIRLIPNDDERRVLWPSSGAVHRDPRDPTEPCLLCQALAEEAARSLEAPAPKVPVESGL